MLCSGAFSVPSFRAAGGTSLGGDSLARSAYITDTDIIFYMLCAIPTVANSVLLKLLPPQQGDRPVRRGRLSAKEPMKGLLLGINARSPSGGRCSVVLSGAHVGSPSG